ncbi:ligase-associated DNA damage response exonuclease [Algoriphagus halophytocola]|uniref:Ligase-associated DNA damage response exonuclease n=1 Tax=Algoriphagus halophytocola TaxID=2991499 RepID=A0ABY6MIF1_9BACT|nr:MULTISPECIES: ligase-associated DNA damage response exonuclease [unclassified Algoriphagus]UZD23571.1 ligase-associated DNA damage response exonuclease [Algoriphagus sp. TR-M5]WBL44865.1 ligase-associated DNA damage response exonuclease [Algoriphagus sp. TR-M9]
MNRPDLLIFNSKGIYCPKAQVYLDPWKPVKNAIITHGHSDHARAGHKNYLTHHSNIPIIKHRLGAINVQGVNWNESFQINGVTFSLHPAGHILGSSQVRVEYKGEVWVFTGDYKDEDDGVAVPYYPVKCHTMITECTFGLPTFKWKPQSKVFGEINQWWENNKKEGKTSVLFGYSLGKAQRILKHLDSSIGKIYTHGAIENMTEVIRPQLDLPETQLVTRDTTGKELLGNMVVAPPSAHGSPWMRKFVPFETGTCSGWMAFRGARARRSTDKGFVLSDHCDWKGLLQSIKASETERVICTHGYTDIFSKYLREVGYEASVENTGYEGENEDSVNSDPSEN